MLMSRLFLYNSSASALLPILLYTLAIRKYEEAFSSGCNSLCRMFLPSTPPGDASAAARLARGPRCASQSLESAILAAAALD